MLHLGLAGNILRVIGGEPRIYGKEFTPQYPRNLLFAETVKMELKPATEEHITTFIDLEAPSPEGQPGPFNTTATDSDIGVLSKYTSISEFYQETLTGLKSLDKKYKEDDRTLFDPNTINEQFQTSDESWGDKEMTTISDVDSAVRALKLVIEQGDIGPHSHWHIFQELRNDVNKHALVCYPVVENPVTSDYKSSAPNVYKVMLASDAVYSYLLLSIETMWKYDGDKRKYVIRHNMMYLMRDIMKPFAQLLVTLELEKGIRAAAPFNLYEFKEGFAFEELKNLVKEALANYPKVDDLDKVQSAVNKLVDIEKLKEPKI